MWKKYGIVGKREEMKWKIVSWILSSKSIRLCGLQMQLPFLMALFGSLLANRGSLGIDLGYE